MSRSVSPASACRTPLSASKAMTRSARREPATRAVGRRRQRGVAVRPPEPSRQVGVTGERRQVFREQLVSGHDRPAAPAAQHRCRPRARIRAVPIMAGTGYLRGSPRHDARRRGAGSAPRPGHADVPGRAAGAAPSRSGRRRRRRRRSLTWTRTPPPAVNAPSPLAKRWLAEALAVPHDSRRRPRRTGRPVRYRATGRDRPRASRGRTRRPRSRAVGEEDLRADAEPPPDRNARADAEHA